MREGPTLPLHHPRSLNPFHAPPPSSFSLSWECRNVEIHDHVRLIYFNNPNLILTFLGMWEGPTLPLHHPRSINPSPAPPPPHPHSHIGPNAPTLELFSSRPSPRPERGPAKLKLLWRVGILGNVVTSILITCCPQGYYNVLDNIPTFLGM